MIDRIVYYFRSLFKQPFKVGIILLDYTEENSGGSGVSIHASTIARELSSWGCEVHIFTRGESNSTQSKFYGDGKLVLHRINPDVKIISNNNTLKRRMSHILFENLSIPKIIEENKRGKFDVIQTHNLATEGAFVSKYFLEIPWINTFHSVEKIRVSYLEPEEKKYLDLTNWTESTLLYADMLISVSENLKKDIVANYKIDPKKIEVIPNGVDLSFFDKPSDDVVRKKNVLYIGRFSAEKGIDFIPAIAEKVLDSNSEITFTAATGSFLPNVSKQQLYNKFEELEKKFPGRFVWYRRVLNKDEMKKLYRESAIYIQPSRYESFGMTVLEAMASGCSIVCSNRGGLPELVANAGISISPSADKFSEKILMLIENYRLRERYSRRAMDRAKIFEWRDIALKTLNVYKRAAKEYSNKKNEDTNSAR